MMKKNLDQSRLVIGLEDGSEQEFILELLLEMGIWAPLRISEENIQELEEEHNARINLPDVPFEKILLISSYSKEALSRFIERLKSNELNLFISSIF